MKRFRASYHFFYFFSHQCPPNFLDAAGGFQPIEVIEKPDESMSGQLLDINSFDVSDNVFTLFILLLDVDFSFRQCVNCLDFH